MKALIITVAGTATRFNKDTSRDTLKCLYFQENPRYSLLYQILDKARSLDKYIIVGGYLFEELSAFINCNLQEFKDKIELVYNSHYEDYGSGYSLIKGIEAVSSECDEVIFVEGDLFYDGGSFEQVISSNNNVITANREFITSRKSVVLYVDMNGHIHYLYDTKHLSLEIAEPFQAIYNSAQIWKFLSVERLSGVIRNLTPTQIRDTNLEIIQGYFGSLPLDTMQFVPVDTWYNCNTVSDYNIVYSLIKQHEINK